jgi:ABC-2 type transport system ATP-binding protein
MTEAIAISFRHLRKLYRQTVAVRDLSLDIYRGEFFGLLGPNGAGKTTSINVIAGLVKPTSGQILIEGLDAVRDYRRVHRRVGIAPQEEALDSWFLNVREILIYQAGYFGIAPREAQRRADALLQQFDLWEKRQALVKELSGGMKRRLIVAKALIHQPDILILDEPTAGADVALRHQIWELLRSLNAQGKTVLLTTHYLEEAEQLCKRVAIIDHGELLAVGAPAELTAHAQTDLVEIEFERPLQELPQAMALDGVAHQLVDGKLQLHGRLDEKAVVAALGQLAQAGLAMRAINSQKARLEDVFLQLTEGNKQ